MAVRGTSIETYRARRDFGRTPEPAPAVAPRRGRQPIFVVQRHAARRLHWDFRLEHRGVLLSWAVPKGPSMDPSDKRLAVRTEDHPLDYAGFEGRIPQGQYGAGEVAISDRGTWRPVGDVDDALNAGELKFRLDGQNLTGAFVLVRLKPKPGDRAENWLLIKEKEETPAPRPKPAAAPAKGDMPAGAVRRRVPADIAPQLASVAEEVPEAPGWISEIKFDGYRLMIHLHGSAVRLVTRNGHDWTSRLTRLAGALQRLRLPDCVLDGEMVALRPDGHAHFGDLQAALAEGRDDGLTLFLFDALAWDGWDLRPCALAERKALLQAQVQWSARIRFSDHVQGAPHGLRRRACAMGLEGLVCKRADAPYRSGRTRTWLKVKCLGREEFVVLGWTPPEGSRTGLGSLHVGYRAGGAWHYAGGVGSGFEEKELAALRARLDGMKADPPTGLMFAGDPIPAGITWVRPELVIEVQFTAWSGAGRIRHAVYLGLREDKTAGDVQRESVADPDALRQEFCPPRRLPAVIRAAAPPRKPVKPAARKAPARTAVVRAAAPDGAETVNGVRMTHPDRELWPGITKRDLAAYWLAMAPHALPGIAGRPLALVRCPEGIGGERFFQKHGMAGQPSALRAVDAAGDPYLALDDAAGLVACAQLSAIELHAWGAEQARPDHPDRLVFDLDPDEGLPWPEVVAAAHEVRKRLKALKLTSFCRTTGGKGLHVVVPLDPRPDWAAAKPFARAFAEAMVADAPDRYVAVVSKARRRGRILVDWLRNGRGATAIATYSPRARPGATVAMPISWAELTPELDPAAFTLHTVPDVVRARRDPWAAFARTKQALPATSASTKGRR